MAQRKRTTKRTSRARRSRQPKPVEPEIAVAEEEEAEDDSYTEWGVPDLREELEARDLDTKGRKSVLVKRLIADDAADDDEPEPEPAPKRVRRTRTAVKVAKPEEKVDEPEPVTAEVDVQGSTPLSDVTMAIINMLEVGKAVTLVAIPNGYTITLGGVEAVWSSPMGTPDQSSAKAKSVKKGLRGKAYDDEVESVEYIKFDDVDCGFEDRGWHDLSVEEKFEYADELGAEVQEHDNEKVMLMRLKPAVLKAMGIKKYKPEYQTRAARKALKEGTG